MPASRSLCGEVRRVTLSHRATSIRVPHCALAEIRDFPKGLSADRHSELLQMCDRGIRNCIKLRSCTWTRDGSLQSTVLESLAGCSQLQELEINGNDSGYDPVLLTQFSHLSKISLIMPSVYVLDVLPTWFPITGETLRSLTIICKVRQHVGCKLDRA